MQLGFDHATQPTCELSTRACPLLDLSACRHAEAKSRQGIRSSPTQGADLLRFGMPTGRKAIKPGGSG
ncbi:hypothetical protein GCM10027597_03330 [Saccharopolyspora tripterygii]